MDKTGLYFLECVNIVGLCYLQDLPTWHCQNAAQHTLSAYRVANKNTYAEGMQPGTTQASLTGGPCKLSILTAWWPVQAKHPHEELRKQRSLVECLSWQLR